MCQWCVIVGMEAGEPPHGRHVMQDEGKLVAAEENASGRMGWAAR